MSLRTDLEKLSDEHWRNTRVKIKSLSAQADLIQAAYDCQLTDEQKGLVNPAANFVWRDYDPETMTDIEKWLDEGAVRSTGLDDGFRDFYEYWANEDGFVVGENFWCKVVCENDKPVAVIAFCQHEQKALIMEIVVDPQKRGQGIGTKLLKELLGSEKIIGSAIRTSEAVIFPSNTASKKAFENAGFHYHHTHEDGTSMLYVYE